MDPGLLICQLKDVIGLFSLGLLALLHGCKMAATVASYIMSSHDISKVCSKGMDWLLLGFCPLVSRIKFFP